MIRIAKGPPTCEGIFLWRCSETSPWIPVRIKGDPHLWGYSELEPLPIRDWNTRGQWSTRIPDPIEETDGE